MPQLNKFFEELKNEHTSAKIDVEKAQESLSRTNALLKRGLVQSKELQGILNILLHHPELEMETLTHLQQKIEGG